MKVVRFMRETAGMSQTELAVLMGTTQPRVADWEAGRARMNDARQKVALAHLRRRLPDWRLKLADLDRDLVDFMRARFGA